jgi:hypothetical protein
MVHNTVTPLPAEIGKNDCAFLMTFLFVRTPYVSLVHVLHSRTETIRAAPFFVSASLFLPVEKRQSSLHMSKVNRGHRQSIIIYPYSVHIFEF